MKGVVLCALLAAFGLTACTLNDISVSEDDSNAIGFDTYAGNAANTRASIVTLEVMKDAGYAGFGVFAYHNAPSGFTSGDLMYNQQVKWNTSVSPAAWTYSPIKYWPTMSESTVDFYAYAPHVASPGVTNNMALTTAANVLLPFTVPTDITSQQDLLIAYKSGAKKSEGKVILPFKHALSRIGMTVSYLVDGAAAALPAETTITLNSITLGASTSQGATNAFYTGGTVNLSKSNEASDTYPGSGLWTPSGAYQTFTYNVETTPALFKNSSVQLTSSVKTIENAENAYLMVIPQNLSELPVTVTYTVTTTDSANGNNTSVVTNTVPAKVALDMKPGKAYTLNLKIGLNAIVLDVSETIGWGNNTSGDITIN